MMNATETNLSKEEELAKAKRINQIRTYLPIVGLGAIFCLFIWFCPFS